MAKGKKPTPAKGNSWVNPGKPSGTKPPPYNPFVPRPPRITEKDVVVEVINGQPTVVAVGGKPTYGPGGATQSDWLTQNRPDLVTAPSPAASPPPAPPKFDGYTPDSIYNDTLASIAARRQMALNAATEGERSLSNDYGLGINQDASGATYTGQWAASDQNQLGIDPSNPFSRASLLNKSYFVAGKVGEGSYANRGLLTSGAYQRNQNRDAFRFEGGKDSLLKSFASQLQDYRQRRAQADADARSGQSQASYDLFNRRRDEYDRNYGLNG